MRREAEALLFIALSSLQHHIEQDIDAHDKDEQHQRNAEQRLFLQAAGVAHLLGNGGGQEGDAAEQAVRHVGAVASHHHHGHGLADGAADAQHDTGCNAAPGSGDADLEPGLGIRCAQSQAALLILRRHSVERCDRHRHNAGQDHHRQHHNGAQQAGTGGLTKGLGHGGHQHLHAQQAEHHAGDAAQQLNGGHDHGAHLRACGLGEEHRRQQADGHTDHGGTQRAVNAGQDEGQDAVGRVGSGGSPPGAEQEPEQPDLLDGRHTGEDHVH